MSILNTARRTDQVEHAFYTLQDFMVYTKGIAYLLMGAALVLLPLFWMFLTARDEKMRKF